MIPALIVGGEHRFIEDRLKSNLLRHNIQIMDTWTWDKEPGAVPNGAKMMFFVTDMMSHVLNDAAKAEAARRNLPIVYGTRKWSVNRDRLTAAGYPEVFDQFMSVTPDKTTKLNNPKLSGGYHKADVLTGEIDKEKMYVILRIEDGPEDGIIYSDILLNRGEWNTEKPLLRLQAFLGSIGSPVKLNSLDAWESGMQYIEESFGKRKVYFHVNPTADRITYMPKRNWQSASAIQRKRKTKVADPIEVVIPPVPQETPITPPAQEIEMNSVMAERKKVGEIANIFKLEGTPLHVERTVKVLNMLAEDPSLSCAEISAILQVTPTGRIAYSYKDARNILGLENTNPYTVVAERAMYEAVCRILGVQPKSGTQFVREGTKGRIEAKQNGRRETQPAPQPQVLPFLQPVAAAEPEPLPPEPTIPPAPIATPSVVQFEKSSGQTSDFGELKQIIALLRDEMAKHDIRRLVVSPDDVSMTRVVVVEDRLEF
jgi:hypothetical protein